MNYTFLVTAIGGDIGFNVTKLLRKHYPQSKIIGTDILKENIGLHYIDKFVEVPRADDSNYVKNLDKIIDENGVDLCFVLSEQELKAVTLEENFKNAEKIKSMEKSELLLFLDKFKTNRFFKDVCDIDAPLSQTYSESYSGEYPVIVKTKEGRGSTGVHIINNRDELLSFNFNDSYMIQEFIDRDEEEYTCGVYITKQDEIHSIILRRKLVGDSTGIARLVNDERIKNYIHSIAKNIKSYGSFNIQLRVSDRGPLCFEINPRISSTVAMRDLLGFQDVYWTVEEHFNNKIEYIENNEMVGKMIVRVPDVKII
jgi:carbamoyl-phosphate synthase large subunit